MYLPIHILLSKPCLVFHYKNTLSTDNETDSVLALLSSVCEYEMYPTMMTLQNRCIFWKEFLRFGHGLLGHWYVWRDLITYLHGTGFALIGNEVHEQLGTYGSSINMAEKNM